MTIIHLERGDGCSISCSGTSGFTVTSTRQGDNVAVQIEFDVASSEECEAMVGMLLAQLEDLKGERFVAQCIDHYAQATGKARFKQESGADLVIIRSSKKRKEKAP